MRTRFICLPALILFSAGISFSQVYSNDELQISLLEEGLWVVETSDNTTMYILEGEERAMLIDTGTECTDLDEVVRKITGKPLYVVITHAHPDHAGNIGYFDEVWIHPADTILLGRFNAGYQGRIHLLADGDRFDLGARMVEVIHMPGHTPGSIILIDRQSGSSFSGDAFGSGMVWLQLEPVAPVTTYIASLTRMEKIMDGGIKKIYCGHYPYVKMAYDKSYITSMRLLAAALDQGTAPGATPYPIRVAIGCDEPMVVTDGKVSIVYDPDRIK